MSSPLKKKMMERFNAALRKQEMDAKAETEKAKAQFKPTITWIKISDDDFIAKAGEYELSIEKFGDYWLYTTKCYSQIIESMPINTLAAAKQAAENAYLKHVNK